MDNPIHAFHVGEHHHGSCPSADFDEAAFDHVGGAQFPPQVSWKYEEVQQFRQIALQLADQNGKTTTYAYDDADRLTTVTDAATPGNVTTYGYDTENNLTSIQDANLHTTSFTYDAFGRVTKTTFPSVWA